MFKVFNANIPFKTFKANLLGPIVVKGFEVVQVPLTVGILEYNTSRQDPFLLPVKIIPSKHGDSWKLFLFRFVWLNSVKSTYFYFLAKFGFNEENSVTKRLY